MDISNFKNYKMIIFFILVVITLFGMYYFKDVFMLFFASYVIAASLMPLVDKLSKKMPRSFVISLIYLIGFGLFTLILIPLISLLYKETVLFIKNIPEYFQMIMNYLSTTDFMGKKLIEVINTENALMSSASFGSTIIDKSINFTVSLIYGFTIAFTLAIIVLYMLLDKSEIKDYFLALFPKNMRNKAKELSSNISTKVGGYVVGQLLMMFAVGLITFIGLAIFKLPFSLLIGFIAGVLDIIPIVGPIIAFGLAIIVVFPKGIAAIVAVCAVFAFAQWSTNTFLKPIVLGKMLDLHPLIIIFAIFAFEKFLGVSGVILAPAIAATVCVLFDELYVKTINKE
ncbi:MAG TPA: AI-2E family transporter [Candidatus Adamsella sp.]|nr:AI-2E family transporter [Candidatus Adamsella sp.]